MRAILAALFAISAASLIYLRGNVDHPSYALVDAPIQLRTGFRISHAFVPETNDRLCITIARPITAPHMDGSAKNDPQGVVASYRVVEIDNGNVLAVGQYPPRSSDMRIEGIDYQGFGSFQPVRGQKYEVTFEVVAASLAAAGTDARLRVRLDLNNFGQGLKSRLLLSWGLVLAALVCGVPLLRKGSQKRIGNRGQITGKD